MKKYLFFILYILWVTVSGRAQQMSYMQLDRLPMQTDASTIGCILQDKSGLIWMGSNAGLFSYDGYNLQPHFEYGKSNNVRIYCGVTAGDSIFLGTDNGLLVYNYRTDQYLTPDVDFPGDVRSLVFHENNLWIGTLNGLYRYNSETRELKAFTPHNSQLPHAAVYSLLHTSEGELYIGTYDGFCRLDETGNNFYLIGIPAARREKNFFANTMLEDKERKCLWIGTEGELICYKLRYGQTESISLFQDNSVKSLVFDADKNLLIGTDNGLYIYNPATRRHTHLFHDSRNNRSLSNNIVWSIFSDRDSNIWLGTDNGVSLARNTHPYLFIPIWQLTNSGEGNLFYSVYRDRKGNHWLGGTDGLLFVEQGSIDHNPKTRWYKMSKKDYPLSHNRIRHIYEDRTGNLWIATDGGIERYDEASKQFIPYTIVDRTRSYNANWAYYMFEDHDGNMWISTCLGGLFVIRKDKLLHSASGYCIADKNYTTQDGLKSMFINQVVADHNGNVWIMLYNNGIQKLDTKTGKFTTFRLPRTNEEVSTDFLMDDSEGYLWAGCHNKVLRIDPATDTVTEIYLNQENCNILSMTEVEDNIWISTTKGLWSIGKNSFKVSRIPIGDQRFTCVYYDQTDRRVFLGGYDGIGLCTPAVINATEKFPPIHLTALSANNHKVNTALSIRYATSVELSHNENNLAFEFSDYSYANIRKNTFVYKLEGLDKNWHQVDERSNRILYTNLPYGTYNLMIRHTEDTEEAASMLSVTILPPWYQTLWAKIAYFLIAGGLVGWIINFFTVKNRLKLEQLEKRQILEQTQQKLDFLSNISHDLKTPVSMIVTPISKLLVDVKDHRQKSMLEVVYRNAVNLNDLIHKLLEFNRINRKEDSLLIVSRIELVSFIKNIYTTYKETDVEEKYQWNISCNTDSLYMDMDVIKLKSILGNLLSNATKYTSQGGSIGITLEYDKDLQTVDIRISDTGIGITANELPYIFQRFYQSPRTKKQYEGTGIGLYLVKTYTELHHGKINVTSDVHAGTTFTLTFPVDKTLNQPIAATEESDAQQTTDDNASKPLVLIVDDNPEMRDVIQTILADGYRCIFASNGKEGLDVVARQQPDLIISDLIMPVMDGIEMSRILKKNLTTAVIPIIMLTAKDDKQTERKSLQSQIDAFISKPFDAEILYFKVSQLLHNKVAYETKARMENIAAPKPVEEVASQDEKFLITITQLIEDHISDSDLNVNALCNLSGIGSKQIYRKVKQLTGMSPIEYIKSIRMKKAAMLLQQKKFTVSEVMYMVGYSNASYFSKCFQGVFGKTPKQYASEA